MQVHEAAASFGELLELVEARHIVYFADVSLAEGGLQVSYDGLLKSSEVILVCQAKQVKGYLWHGKEGGETLEWVQLHQCKDEQVINLRLTFEFINRLSEHSAIVSTQLHFMEVFVLREDQSQFHCWQ